MMRDETIDEALVLAAVCALEVADAPLRQREWRALDDRHLREMVSQRLAALGRQLITVTDGEGGPVQGYLSGWSDEVAADPTMRPADLQIGDLAVLALIYLHTEILQGVLDEDDSPVLEGLDAHTGVTGRDVIKGQRLSESLRRLKAHQLITHRNHPGPALQRLSAAQRQRLDENLVLLLRPDSIWAQDIRTARTQGTAIGEPS